MSTDPVKREPLVILTLNDETPSLGTDVPRVSLFSQVLFLQEVTNLDVKTMLPDFDVFQDVQGSAGVTKPGEHCRNAVAVKKNLMTFTDSFWVTLLPPTMKPVRGAVVAHANYEGAEVALISAHRPVRANADQWPTFDRALANLVQSEKDAGRMVIIGLDSNDNKFTELSTITRTKPLVPDDVSIDGFLITGGVGAVGCERLRQATSDHHPVIALVKVLVEP